MKRTGIAIAGILLAVTGTAHAAQTATAQISLASTSGSVNNFAITLNNTGTVNIGTFWYAWVPGADFLDSDPSSVSNPTNWTHNLTGSQVSGSTSDGTAIQWVATTGDELAPSNSLVFDFSSVDSLAQVTSAFSLAHNTTPVGTSFVYQGAPFSGASDEIVATAAPVPEPASFSLLAVGASLLLGRRVRMFSISR